MQGVIKVNLTENNNISYNKSFVIIKYKIPVSQLESLNDITDTVEFGNVDNSFLFKYVRYSYDSESWSMWNEYTNGIDHYLQNIPFNCKSVYLEFKYYYHNDTEGIVKLVNDVVIKQLLVNVDVCAEKIDYDKLINHIEITSNVNSSYVYMDGKGINVYDVGNFEQLAKDMSYIINNTFGFESLYFQTLPDTDSADFIFKEWTLYRFITRKCIKVVSTDNQLPNNMPLFNIKDDQWNEPFDIHIDDKLFKEAFGPLAEPRHKDIIYLPITNRVYTINGVFLQRGFMNIPMYWIVNLVKYQPNINYVEDNENSKFIDNLVLTEEEQLNELLNKQTDDLVDEQQNKNSTTSFDETRMELSNGLDIFTYNRMFNYISLIENYYDLSAANTDNLPLVIYKYKQQLDDELNNLTYFNLFNVKDTGTIKFLNGLDNTKGINIVGEYSTSLDLDIYVNNHNFSSSNINIDIGKWYAMFVSISLEFNQVSLHIYEMVDDESDISNIRNMVLVHTNMWSGNVTSFVDDYYKLFGSNVLLTNIRLFNRLFGEEEHEYIASSYYYRKESELVFIDNCRPQLNAPFIMRKK